MSKHCPLRGIPCDKNCAWYMEGRDRELDACAVQEVAVACQSFRRWGILAYDKV